MFKVKEKGRYVVTSVQLCLALVQSELKTATTNPRGGPWKPGHKGKVVSNYFPSDLSPDKKTVVGGPQ